MSFYWQQALQQNGAVTNSPNEQQQQPNQNGQWDYINLGGPPSQQYQWNPGTQTNQFNNNAQQSYYQQMPSIPINATHPNISKTNTMHSQVQAQGLQQSFAPESKNNVSFEQAGLNSQTEYGMRNNVEHMPILNNTQFQETINPAHSQNAQNHQNQLTSQLRNTMEVHNQPFQPESPNTYTNMNLPATVNSHQQMDYQIEIPPQEIVNACNENTSSSRVIEAGFDNSQSEIKHETSSGFVKKEDLLIVNPDVQNELVSTIKEESTKVTSSSSEDDWEKADMEIQITEDKSKPSRTDEEKVVDSRESSLGGSWSHNESELPETREEQQKRSSQAVWENEMVESVDVKQNYCGQKTEKLETGETINRQKTPESRDGKLDMSNSPGIAQATSTPKDTKEEKRGSISSLQSADRTEEKVNDSTVVGMEKDDRNSGNNSDSTLASKKPELERGSIRASYRNYKQQYSEILKRLNGYRVDKNRHDFRPSSKLANPLLAAAGITSGRSTRNEELFGRSDGRCSVPLPQSQSFNEEMYAARRRVSRLETGIDSSRQSAYQQGNISQDQKMMRQGYMAHGRYSAMGAPYRNVTGYDPRRPQSTYTDQYSSGYGQAIQDASSLSDTEGDDDNVESDDELRRYNMQNSNNQSSNHLYQHPSVGDGSELYYFGVVHIDMETVHRIMERQPPPPQYFSLPPIEKAAFMFYAAVYKQQYKNIDAFHKRFNREFFKYACAGDSNDVALYKICKSMQDQYVARMNENKHLAYEKSQKHLFSDDNSVDGQSEITSICENEESVSSMDVYNKGPLKFTYPHAFMTFGVGGKTISIQPDQSISVVFMNDIKSYLKDVPTLRILDIAQNFKGPLIPNLSARHTVLLYISKQIEAIKRSDVAQENPFDNDVVESLLVWQLLEIMVKQQGNITGPDIAELLAKVANQPINVDAPQQNANIGPALNQFTQFLLGGHIDEAIEGAIRNGLFADALVLTRRLYPNDERKIAEIEERFMQTRSFNNPVTTLVSVASGLSPPVLTNPPLDDNLSWRTHAAIILANLDQKETAMNTIYQLGRALAKRDYHCAADFCFLVVCVLAGLDPFSPIHAGEGEEEYRRHISLINSGIPDDDECVKCQYGFSITDLHATEIFDYALRLKTERGESPLTRSVEYQNCRMKYAKLMASHGLTSDAYRYCLEIARSIWHYYTLFNPDDLLEMCDLADSIHYVASADPSELSWFEELRKMCISLKNYQLQANNGEYSTNHRNVDLNKETAYLTSEDTRNEHQFLHETNITNEPNEIATNLQPNIESSTTQYEVSENSEAVKDISKNENQDVAYYSSHSVENMPGPQLELSAVDQPEMEQRYNKEPSYDNFVQLNQTDAAKETVTNDHFNSTSGVEQKTLEMIGETAPRIEQFGNPGAAQSGINRNMRGVSRYGKISSNTSNSLPPANMMAPPMQTPASFGFIPAPTDDDNYVDPFSGQADPTIQEAKPKSSNDE